MKYNYVRHVLDLTARIRGNHIIYRVYEATEFGHRMRFIPHGACHEDITILAIL